MLLQSEPVSEDVGLLTLRAIGGGSLLFAHGWPKLAHFADKVETFGDPIGLGPAVSLGLVTFAETVCAALVMLGLWTRITTLPVIVAMAVAAFMAHGDEPFKKQELAVVYLCIFLALFFTGSGRFSLDRLKFQ